MSLLGIILLFIVVGFLFGGYHGGFGGYGYGYGHRGMGLLGVILLIVLVLVWLGRI
jgi:hypothetical protein